MIRNAQNIGATRGIVSAAASLICSGVASTTFAVYFLSSSAWPRSSLVSSKRWRTSGLLSPPRIFCSIAYAVMPLAMRRCAFICSSLIPMIGVSTDRVAIRPSSQGILIAYSVTCFSWFGKPNAVIGAGGGTVSHSASISASFTFCTSPVV